MATLLSVAGFGAFLFVLCIYWGGGGDGGGGLQGDPNITQLWVSQWYTAGSLSVLILSTGDKTQTLV